MICLVHSRICERHTTSPHDAVYEMGQKSMWFYFFWYQPWVLLPVLVSCTVWVRSRAPDFILIAFLITKAILYGERVQLLGPFSAYFLMRAVLSLFFLFLSFIIQSFFSKQNDQVQSMISFRMRWHYIERATCITISHCLFVYARPPDVVSMIVMIRSRALNMSQQFPPKSPPREPNSGNDNIVSMRYSSAVSSTGR